MKSMLVIGIGRFGQHLATKLAELGNEVMVVDKDEANVARVADVVTSAQIGDCTRADVLETLAVDSYDVCFVCLGHSFQGSLEITALLKEMGARYVISRASSSIHAKFLLSNGADEVTYPERDVGTRLATNYSSRSLFDYLEVTKDVSIFEIDVDEAWVGRTIAQVNFRAKYNVNIIAIKAGDEVLPLPKPDHVFAADQHLMVVAHHKDMDKLLKYIEKQNRK